MTIIRFPQMVSIPRACCETPPQQAKDGRWAMKNRILHTFHYLQHLGKRLTDRFIRVYNPLNKLVRRIKRVMANWLITWGGMFFPAGLVLLILPLTLKSGVWQAFFLTAFGILFIIFSIWCFAKALIRVQSEEKREEDRFQELMIEIRQMRRDLTRRQKKQQK